MTQPVYGCHNREPYKPSLVVQDGWFHRPGADTRLPRMVVIPFRNRPDCVYTTSDLGRTDPRCSGCACKLENA